jgi:hypothetical protein
VDVAIHTPHGHTDIRNHHAHVMMTTRKVGPEPEGRVRLLFPTTSLPSATHKLAGRLRAEGVKATIRGIRRSIGAAKVQKAAATADLLRYARRLPERSAGEAEPRFIGDRRRRLHPTIPGRLSRNPSYRGRWVSSRRPWWMRDG